MKKLMFFLTLAVVMASGHNLCAQEIENPNEFRFGVGDNFFEPLFYGASVHKDYSDLPATKTYDENADYHYIPHFFLEYYRTIRPWLSVGGQVDVGGFNWKLQTYRGGAKDDLISSQKQNCVNVCVLPAVRFNWLNRGIFSCFSTVRAGIDINTGTEVDYLGHKTAVGFAIDPTYIGFALGGKHWNGAFELGSLFAFRNSTQIFLAASKLISLSVGYKF